MAESQQYAEATPAADEEIRKAKELLEANGYLTVGYRERGNKVMQAESAGIDFIKGKWKSFCGWLSAKRDEMNVRQEERIRVAPEGPKCAACGAELVLGGRFCRKCGSLIPEVAAAIEAAARRAEIAKKEILLDELNVEMARLRSVTEDAMAETLPLGSPRSLPEKGEAGKAVIGDSQMPTVP